GGGFTNESSLGASLTDDNWYTLMTPSMIDLSIAIVSYNTKEVLIDCLRSIHAHTIATTFEAIVVDNDSRDGTVAALKDVYPAMRVVQNTDNPGFAKAKSPAGSVSGRGHVLWGNSE